MCDVAERLENKGITKGKFLTLFELIKNGIITTEQAAETAKMSISDFERAMKEAGFGT